ncbi:hypothetical protein DMUE_2405 [Dictyocoela muelleri]|nr:hypothetical protein DMUE_2405 [Dictyocoela muelleri]
MNDFNHRYFIEGKNNVIADELFRCFLKIEHTNMLKNSFYHRIIEKFLKRKLKGKNIKKNKSNQFIIRSNSIEDFLTFIHFYICHSGIIVMYKNLTKIFLLPNIINYVKIVLKNVKTAVNFKTMFLGEMIVIICIVLNYLKESVMRFMVHLI